MHARSCWERLGRLRFNRYSLIVTQSLPCPLNRCLYDPRGGGHAGVELQLEAGGFEERVPRGFYETVPDGMPDVACTPVRDVRPHGLNLSDRHDARPGVAPPGTGATALRERQSRSHTSQSAIISRKARVHASNGETDSQRPAVCAHNTYLNQTWIHVPDSTPATARQCNDECN